MDYRETIKSYYQITKPGIIYGNLFTAIAGFLFASQWHNNYTNLIGMLLGLGLVIGSGCVMNNIIDKDVDLLMERTKKRATVTGKIKSQTAFLYGLLLLILGSALLIWLTNTLTFYLALFGYVMYVIVYTYSKRKTVYSTLIGSISGAMPPLIGYAAVANNVGLTGILLVFTLICWQMAHFYAIALYRKKEYKKAKLPIWSVVKGDWSTQLQTVAFIALFTLFALSLFTAGNVGIIYLVAVFILGLVWLWYGVLTIRKKDPDKWGRSMFFSSLKVIVIFSVILALSTVLP